MIIEILALSLVENGVIFRYNHLRRGDYSEGQIFKIAASRFVNVSEEEINLMKENAISRNTKYATRFGMTLFKDKMWKLCET